MTLKAVPGITKVINVSLDGGEALVDGTADPQALVAAIEAVGFHAESMP